MGWLDEVCLLASIPDPPHPQKTERALMSMMVRQANGLSRASGVDEHHRASAEGVNDSKSSALDDK